MIFTLDEEPKGIELLYYTGKYVEAYEFVQKALKSSKKNQPNHYQLLIWNLKLRPSVGKFSNIEEEVKDLIEILVKEKKHTFLLEAILVHVSILNAIGRIDEIIKEINYGESFIKNLVASKKKDYFKAIYLFYKGSFYTNKAEHEVARSHFEESLSIFQKNKLYYFIALVQISLARSYRGTDKADFSFDYLNKALDISMKYNFQNIQAKALQNIGIVYNYLGDLTQALENLQKSLEINKIIGSPNALGNSNLNLGVLHHFRGNLNSALDYYQQALEYYQIVGNMNYISAAQYNIGLIFNLQGKLQEALERFEIVLPIMQKVGNISLITACFNSLGKIYYDLGFYEKAENHLSTVYQLKDNITKMSLSKALFYLIPVLLKRNELEKTKQLIDDLESILDDNITVNHRYLVLKALYISSTENYDFNEVEKLFVKVINEPIADHETTVEAIIQLTKLLILEYTKTKNNEQLERIKYYADRLSKIATKQQSRLLFVEHFWLKSRIALFENDTVSANQLAKQARDMAQEMNFQRLLSKMDECKAKNHTSL
ncbi:MAG: tetratricopeptide repeat protein [Asgard group archaeon]|nr:tetratricopeptide repeat protein [Asgard group archaeon]